MDDRIAAVKNAKKVWLDAIRGCLIGGAAGDALGYPVEFLSVYEIKSKYGNEGIDSYEIDKTSNLALISDVTQMTLFTATGLLYGFTRGAMRGIMGNPEDYVGSAYNSWYQMQKGLQVPESRRYSWLCDVPEMGASRAPGNICMNVIGSGSYGTVDKPINQSKGCGGIMRVAPVGLYLNRNPKEDDIIRRVDELAANVAALTHGHDLGYMPAAALSHILNRIVYGGCHKGNTLLDIVNEAINVMRGIYADRQHIRDLCDIMKLSVQLAFNEEDDLTNIKRLGEGWVTEETLAIAVYCSLKYKDDFSKALCTSVNHGVDSDSTGAVTGNILGALWGYENIPSQWRERLECADIILEIADDLCYDCLMSEYNYYYDDPAWVDKYMRCSRYAGKAPTEV